MFKRFVAIFRLTRECQIFWLNLIVNGTDRNQNENIDNIHVIIGNIGVREINL
jgi:hypothetical protein